MPRRRTDMMASSARGPWPWPRATTVRRSPISRFCARDRSSPVGSAPTESTKITGMPARVDGYTASRLEGGFSAKCAPRFARTNSLTMNSTWDGDPATG